MASLASCSYTASTASFTAASRVQSGSAAGSPQGLALPLVRPLRRSGALPEGLARGVGKVRRAAGVSMVAAPASQFYSLSDEAERKRLAVEYGFTKIGEPVPDGVTLKQVQDSLPPEVFEINEGKAWKSVALTLVSMAVAEAAIAVAPWYLLPLAWAFAGTAFTGFFVVGHDCAHKCFSKNKLVEDIVGTVMMMPLIYPYEPWRFKHDQHHAKTNMLVKDTAWHPVMKDEYANMPPAAQAGLRLGMGPVRPWASIGHWLAWHFDLKKYTPSQQGRVKISLAAVFGFMAVAFPLLIAKAGIVGWAKFWLMPWLGYHFWMSTFTMVHHTAPHIPFKKPEEWNGAKAQLGGTVHCEYPRWVEVLCHDINVHVPHHISQRIPWYNLRPAYKSLQENWGKYLNEAKFNKTLMRTIMAECHFYDEERNYLPFDAGKSKEDPFIWFVRRVLA